MVRVQLHQELAARLGQVQKLPDKDRRQNRGQPFWRQHAGDSDSEPGADSARRQVERVPVLGPAVWWMQAGQLVAFLQAARAVGPGD